jgi:hypothetical protein
VIHAPLVDGWYDVVRIPDGLACDLLVVDGPPAVTPADRDARLPAVGFFGPRLTADATVVVDDARRPGERQMIAEWRRRSGREFRVEPGGFALSTPYDA